MSTAMQSLKLERDPLGRLVLVGEAGAAPEPLVPVRAFPLTDPDHGISLVGSDGRERVWIHDLGVLPEASRRALHEVLAVRDFAPTLLVLHKVSSFGVPSIWSVSTDRGETSFVLKAEEDIRRLEDGALLIASAAGVQFRVPKPSALDRQSRKLLERFL
ncbi:DUF1854 domain-containing protein [Variovorax sp. OV329]|uniref:cyanophycin metabolism-associated DUF1854 family protein n=1 Tax=Variovorax sp. OV329 TaxID=1882825 RepID=UPI0008F311CB|nr:DUF1854 domain-containing protein [Variovorax sp. OV329]SFM16645.1 protein of unknown function [Variovorax sp. OV329]